MNAAAEKENCINSCIVSYKDVTEEEKSDIKKEFENLFYGMINKIENGAENFYFYYYVRNLL